MVCPRLHGRAELHFKQLSIAAAPFRLHTNLQLGLINQRKGAGAKPFHCSVHHFVDNFPGTTFVLYQARDNAHEVRMDIVQGFFVIWVQVRFVMRWEDSL